MANSPAKQNDAEVEPARELTPAVKAIMDRARATGRYASGATFLLQALGAETLEEATEIGEVLGAREHLLGERLKVLGVTFMDSDPELDSPVPLFAIMDVVREMTGERVKASCGSSHVLGVLIRACEMDWFPFDAELDSVSVGKAKNAINMRLAPTRVDTITGDL